VCTPPPDHTMESGLSTHAPPPFTAEVVDAEDVVVVGVVGNAVVGGAVGAAVVLIVADVETPELPPPQKQQAIWMTSWAQ